MATSEARILANRENAKKSTGPRTDEGKVRSRRNALRHGLAGEGVVLPPEDEARLRERIAAWGECLGPRNALEEYLISRAALHSVKLDRTTRVDAARVLSQVQQAEADFAPERLERLGRIESAMRLLHRLAALLEWRGWLDRDDLRDLGALLGPFEPGDPRPVELVLLGRDALPPPSPDQPTPSTLPPELLALHPAPPPPPESEHDRARRAYARAALAEMIAARRERLDEQRRRLRDEIASPEALLLARERAAFDDSEPGNLLRRYETASELGLFRVLNYLERRRRFPEQEPAEAPVFAPEPEPSPARFAATLAQAEPEPIFPPWGRGEAPGEGPTDLPPAGPASPAEPSAATDPPPDVPRSAPVNLGESGKPCRFLNEPKAPDRTVTARVASDVDQPTEPAPSEPSGARIRPEGATESPERPADTPSPRPPSAANDPARPPDSAHK